MSAEQNPTVVPALSERELEMLKLVAAGLTNNQIAREKGISTNTVKVHLNNIYTKLGVQSRTEAAMYAVRQGWLEVKREGQPLDGVLPAEPAPPPAESVAAESIVVAPPLPEAQPATPTIVAPQRSWLRPRVIVPAALASLLLAFIIYQLLGAVSLPPTPFIPTVTAPSITPPRWQMKSPLTTAREAMAVAVVDGLIYVIGGLSDGKTLADVSVYDPIHDKWGSKASKPTAVQEESAAVIGGRIYVPGGCDAQNQPTDAMEVYDPASDSWRKSTPLPKAVCHYAISALEGKLYVFGGWDGSSVIANVFAFDPVRNEWTEKAPLPEPRADAAAAVVNEHIYVVGGRTAADRLLSDVLIFDPTQDRSSGKSWTARAALLHPRAKLGLVSLTGNLYVMGGGWSGALADNERYDTMNDRWLPLENSLEVLWKVGGTATLDTKFYLMGGSNDKPTASVQEYTALYRFFLPDVSPPSK